uniref:Putative phosphoglycerate mutase-like protein n=1 Tax=Moniliophthora roreri TaxID=221103 RepID=A0A0W0EXY4_MONRR
MISLAGVAVLCSAVSLAASSPVHYPPSASDINNLASVINGTGAPGIFNSSATPDDIYGIYNWCNMPHVRKREYKRPSKEFTLEYVEVIQRHHKRTPYASNTFFKEDIPWDCTNAGQIHGGKGPSGLSASVVQIQWNSFRDQSNPWSKSVGPGFVGSNCIFPQLTPEALEDSHVHGSDLREVYAPLLGLKDHFDPSVATIRVTNNVITSQVAAGLGKGLFPNTSKDKPVQVIIQPTGIDSLEPQYRCSKADAIRSAYTGSNANWTAHLDAGSALYDKLDSVSGIARDDSAGWHTSFDHYYDNLSAKQCHSKPLPCSVNDTSLCVTQEEANTVYRLGNYEYSYYFRDAPDSTVYSALHFGAWFGELKGRLQDKVDGKSGVKYYHNIGHDGSMASLMGFLQIDKMVWPGMGSEVVFELYNKQDAGYFLRVLWGGQPMVTSTPLGLSSVTLGGGTQLVRQYVDIDSMTGSPADLFAACNAS